MRVPWLILAAVLLLSVFCVAAQSQPPGGRMPPGAPPGASDASLTRRVSPDAGSTDAPLLIGLGVHVEPLGAVPSRLVGQAAQPEQVPLPQRRPLPGPFGTRPPPDYHQRPFFQKHVADLRTLAEILQRHQGKLTVQAQTPFTQMAVELKEPLLADLENNGHEIGLHFHEDAHLGRGCERLPVQTWTAVIKEEIALLRQAGASRVRYWSGGNLYPHVLEAAAEAGLEVMSDHKNPRQQRTDERLLAVVPWRPAGGPRENDVADFARHDPRGKIVYLPDGKFGRVDFNSMRRSQASGGDAAYFDFLTTGLEESLRAAKPDRVNVFHVTVHAGEFRGGPGGKPFAVIDQWLTEVVDPLVRARKVRWATFSEMADSHAAWEKTHPGVDPRASATPADTLPQPLLPPKASREESPPGSITFVINVHDWCHVAESADTLLRLIRIFQKHKVRGDFYLTAPIVEAYQQQRPEVITRLRERGMTISYHFRPPHPAYAGFDRRLRGLDDESLVATLRDYESYRLDLATGELQRDKPGGYAYVKKMLGCPPVVVSALSRDPRIKTALLDIYRQMGAQMTMEYHESGTDPNKPFEWRQGLLIRPSDFSITRWALPGEPQESFWWNRLDTPRAAEFDPTARLKSHLAAWNGPRPPLVTALIHENNFYRRGPEAWTFIYYSGPERGQPLVPPFDLRARDRSNPLTTEQQETIWRAYEELVAYAATRLRVVTSAEIVKMALAAK